MKKIIPLLAIILLAMVSCHRQKSSVTKDGLVNDTIQSFLDEDNAPIKIEEVCKDAEKDILTPEEAAHWDSMNAEGGHMLIRNAERNLDTIVNHLHMVFTTDR